MSSNLPGIVCRLRYGTRTGEGRLSFYWNYFVSTYKGAKFMLVIISDSVPAPLP